MTTLKLSNVLELPVEERLKLMELIWDSIIEFPENVPLTDEHKKELDVRLIDLENNPNDYIPWEEAKELLLRNR